jgi:cytochrome P450
MDSRFWHLPWSTVSTRSGLLALCAISAVLLALLLWRKLLSGRITLPGIPRLRGHPIFGVVPSLFRDGLPKLVDSLIKAAGDDDVAYCWVGNATFVAISDPKLIRDAFSLPESVMRRENPRANGSPFTNLRRFVGPSLFNFVGTEATVARAAYAPILTGAAALENNCEFLLGLCEKHVDRVANSSPILQRDLKRLADDFAMDLWGQFLFEMSDAHLDAGDLLRSTTSGIADLVIDVRHNFFHDLKARIGLPDPPEDELVKNFAEIVQTRLVHIARKEQSGAKMTFNTLRKFCIATGGPKDGPFNPGTYGLARQGLFGGHQTIGLIIPWTVYELNRNVECMQKVQTELKAFCPSGSLEGLSVKDFENGTPYLDAVIAEVHRLHSAVHSTSRVVVSEVRMVSSKGKQILLVPGTRLYISFHHLHANERLWGPDVHQFVPERFLDEKRKTKEHFMPFGYGKRMCVGFKFAELAAKLYLILLLRNYEVTMKNFGQIPRFTGFLDVEKPFPFTVKKFHYAVPEAWWK